MKKAIPKPIGGKRAGAGRPATGRDPVMAIRFPPKLRGAVTKWAEKQADAPKISEAVRRLVEAGLTVNAAPKQSSDDQKARAKQMAGGTIDRMADTSATTNDQENRKRRLLKGPEEFRNVRIDRKIKK